MLKGCGRAVPALCSVPQGSRKTMGGAHKRKGRLRCTSGPSLGRKRPRRAAIAGWGVGGRYRIPLAKTISISGSIERRDHGPIRRFIALAFKAEPYRNGSSGEVRAGNRKVGFALNNGLRQRPSACLKSAKSGNALSSVSIAEPLRPAGATLLRETALRRH